MRLRGDEAPTAEDPPDGRDRGQLQVRMSTLEVDPDRLRAGVYPEIRELLADRHDLVLEDLGGPLRAPAGSPRSGLEPRLPSSVEPPAALVDPP